MITFPNIKINLGLKITSKREDGYHNLESCFYPVNWCDALEITEATSFSFESSGLPIPGDPDANLVVKAYELLQKDFGLPPVRVHLLKSIPMGAGLGGGSADGAFMLKLLNDKFSLGLDTARLADYALQLGSDCPFFIQNKPVMAKGRGEIFEPVNLSLRGKYVVLINPGLHIGTREAFSGIVPAASDVDLRAILENTPMDQWLEHVVNDFEKSVFLRHPAIAVIKTKLYEAGARYASMSGSGSTIFGIFDVDPALSKVDGHPVKVLPLT